MDPGINGEDYKEIQSGGRRVQHVCEKKKKFANNVVLSGIKS